MKSPKKSALLALIFAFFSLTVAGCGSGGLPHALQASDVPKEVLEKPRNVGSPSSGAWTGDSELGRVPFAPEDFASPDYIAKTKKDLTKYRIEAEQMRLRTGQPSFVPHSAVQSSAPKNKPLE